ncbi:hypothetical protein IWZ01DRAFT_110453 [Phyllosticta capitalensis]|uniref:BTB domain-containing protein n=1 Tax=Phyllosticta capitalensis TaxID=121624 RepID=A0ABR1YAV3_9PEZI
MSAGCMNPTGPLVQLVTGPEKEIFVAHKELLAKHSPFFKNALCEPWKEAISNVIELPDSDPVVVAVFLEWVYTQKYIAPHMALDLYIFGDKYQISLLETEALRALFSHWAMWNEKTGRYDVVAENLPTAEIIHHALDHLPTTSKLLDMIRDIQANLNAYTPTRRNWPAIKEARSRL